MTKNSKMQKSLITGIFSLFFYASLLAQTVPDFTITDTSGEEHTLYEDYLDKGTTVVIKIFFTTCPPCRAIAPSFQDLYEEWGEGNEDVQFIELSNKGFDTNSAVANYKAMFGLTFPGAGLDGGALTALEPYLDGTLGSFFGTPRFAVIAPDGTYNYDIGGSGSSTIEALDAAIEATGATGGITPPPPVPAVYRLAAHDKSGETLENIEYFIASAGGADEIPISVSAMDEFWIFSLADEFPNLVNPVIRAKKTDDIVKKVDAVDLITILRHILDIVPITDSDFQLAADIDDDGFISGTDLTFLQRIILGINPNFPDNNSYRFVPEEIELIFVPGQAQNLDFKGIKIGDVNGQ